jgi:hypothetical protein
MIQWLVCEHIIQRVAGLFTTVTIDLENEE